MSAVQRNNGVEPDEIRLFERARSQRGDVRTICGGDGYRGGCRANTLAGVRPGGIDLPPGVFAIAVKCGLEQAIGERQILPVQTNKTRCFIAGQCPGSLSDSG